MKVYEVDNFAVQKVMNAMIENGYSNDTIKKNKHLISQFFEYAIDNKWVTTNPTHKIKIQNKDRKFYDDKEHYKALPPDIRDKFIAALNKDESNFIKPLCIMQMFAGTRIGEVLAIKWKNIDFENKTMRIERAITQVPKFDNVGNVIDRITVVGDTKTTCSVREIPIADIVVDTLKEWREKQILRQKTNAEVTADLTVPDAYVFANDDGSVRTYSGTRKIFNRFLKRNGLNKYHIHFHGLRHTFSNMLFEMNENPKVIQQLLGHRDVKTTITVYNSVNSDYVRNTTEKLNEKLKQEQIYKEEKDREQEIEERKDKLISDMDDDEFDEMLEELMYERKRRRQKEEDFEM
jgi:integrase